MDEAKKTVVRRIATFERLQTTAESDGLDGTGLTAEEAQELANRTGMPVDVRVDPDDRPPRRPSPPDDFGRHRPDDPFVEAAEFLCSLLRHEHDEAVALLAPSIVEDWGGTAAAADKLRSIAQPPDFPRLEGGISLGGDDPVQVEGDHATVWLGVLNTRKKYPELNRIRELKLERIEGRWRITSDISTSPYREGDPE